MDIRERLKTYIDETPGLSYRNVAIAAGLSDTTVSKYVSGYTASITFENLERIAKAMDVSLKWLLFGDEDDSVVSMFERIPAKNREKAKKMLELFSEDDSAVG